jgi:hypothetical protein
MKKISFLFVFLASLCYSQEVIYEGDFKSDYKPAGGIPFLTKSNFEQNKFLLLQAKGFKIRYDYLNCDGIIESTSYKHFTKIIESETFNTKLFKNYNDYINVIDENNISYEIDKTTSHNLFSKYIKCPNVNDKYVVGLFNEKLNEEIDIIKNDIFLYLYDFKLKKTITQKIEKPSLERLKSNKNKSGFSIIKITNDNFILVTKANNEEHNQCVIYLTTYGFDGKIISEKEIVIDSGSDFLLYSSNGAGQYDFDQTSPAGKDIYKIDDEMFINNIFFDESDTSGEFYVFGLIGSKPAKLNAKIRTKGFYVNKYNKNGVLIWNKTQDLSRSELLRDSFHSYLISTSMTSIGNDICFFAFADRLKHYVNFSILNKENGNVTLNKEMEQKEKLKIKYFQTQLLYAGSKIDAFDDKLFDLETIASIYNDKRILNYINNVKVKKTVMFNTLNLKDYVVLVETDNKKYFKFTKFKK